MTRIIAMMALVFSSGALAFQINPLNRKSDGAEHSTGLLSRVSGNVHERITNKARIIFLENCCLVANKSGCAYEQNLMSGRVIQDSLIRGGLVE